MITISFIVAAAEDNAIGKNNQLLWNLPTDLKFFKNTTWGMPIIMGRKTYESCNQPLPGRFNIVITHQKDWKAEGTVVTQSIDEAIEKAKETNAKEIFIIGGGEVFKQSMEIANRIYMTRVHGTFKDADAFFPAIDESKWKLVSNHEVGVDDKHAYACSFQTWEKIKS
jgi:dihydrofolate reductase